MMTRCKFKCVKVEQYASGAIVTYNATLEPVSTGSEENKNFWHWTPSGKLELGTIKSAGFQAGKEYYLDISEAAPEQEKAQP